MLNKKIAAIIVTYNRKKLLIQCLDTVLSQTSKPDKIIIIDNASTDGTSDILQEKGYLDKPIVKYVHLKENTGGAGGFYQGMKIGHNDGYDYLWLMDDDGYPEQDCLEKLLLGKEKFDIIGPSVVLPNDSSSLTWGVRSFNSSGQFKPRGLIYRYSQLVEISHNGWYDGFANFFNGILLKKEVMDKVGYILPELFCWGDDLEYFLRCKSSQIKIGTSTQAIYRHPYNSPSTTKLRYYYVLRNLFYNYSKYGKTIYPKYWRLLYPIYILIKYIRQIPSLSPRYIWTLFQGIYKASQKLLVPFPLYK